MNDLIQRLNDLALRHKNLVFDLRGNCRVLYGIAVAYHHAGHAGQSALSVLGEALEQDGIISVARDPVSGAIAYSPCRLFTDTEMAMRFARAHGQAVILNLNRSCEVAVPLVDRSDLVLEFGVRR